MLSLNEQYAENLQGLLYTLKLIKAGGGLVDGIQAGSYFNFARSEIFASSQGFQTKDECKGCNPPACCISPQALVPAQGPDGGLARPMRYVLKYRNQPCPWLRDGTEGFKCSIHDTSEKPFTCFQYLCTSPEELRKALEERENKLKDLSKKNNEGGTEK